MIASHLEDVKVRKVLGSYAYVKNKISGYKLKIKLKKKTI